MGEVDLSNELSGRNEWGLILGGSSGIGLASAKSLAEAGLNLFIVHRDRRGSMAKINPEFDSLRNLGIELHAFNVNALEEEGRISVLNQMADLLGSGKVRCLLHSIALGNLKLLAPMQKNGNSPAVTQLASRLGIEVGKLQDEIDEQFAAGGIDLLGLATSPDYSNENLLGEEDWSQTIFNMGTSLAVWVRDLFSRTMFADDARVLGLTSEGNEIAWRGYAAVAAAKCALESVSRAIAKEYAPYGIKCNVLQPGVTETPALKLIPGSRHMLAAAQSRNPFGRLTTPEDVAKVVKLMCLPDSAWINGTTIRVDGGEHISG
jgi:NAD(P)-dependent dehydrogenase (short-subunit alcohol dehydrogenase family)